MPSGWRRKGAKVLHKGFASLSLVKLESPDGHELTREVEHHGEAVVVLPYDPDRKVALLVSQFRAPVFEAAGKDALLEAPAGIRDDESPEEGARRELREEAGLEVKALEFVGSFWSMPGISTERMHFFLAAYGETDRNGDGGGLAEEHEHITVVEKPLAALDDGSIDDLKTMFLVNALRLRRPDLFR